MICIDGHAALGSSCLPRVSSLLDDTKVLSLPFLFQSLTKPPRPNYLNLYRTGPHFKT